MELELVTGLLVGATTISTVAATYVIVLYKGKYRENLSLQETIDINKNNIAALESNLNEKRSSLTKVEVLLATKSTELQHLLDLEREEQTLVISVKNHVSRLASLQDEIKILTEEQSTLSRELASVQRDMDLFSPTSALINVGFFEEPKYLFETSDRYKEEIKKIRAKQKELIKSGDVIAIPDEIAIIPDATYSVKAVAGQAKMMLRAYNIECDLLIGAVKPSNFPLTLERIEKAATDLEKTAMSFKVGFSSEYVRLKYQECELQYQFKLKQQSELEEQRLIKEQMREEQQAMREYERALAKVQKEEQMYQDALKLARKELELAGNEEKDALSSKIALLEAKLLEAENNERRAKSMAEQTRRGHVYVISNIGSFGEDVYKIGMTRRLEPLDRVKELGDASVPFSFDVHAMIFSEDAPSLERELHKAFANRRVNAINFRKEFFRVDLVSIQEKVNNITSIENEFRMTAIAEDFYASQKLTVERQSNF